MVQLLGLRVTPRAARRESPPGAVSARWQGGAPSATAALDVRGQAARHPRGGKPAALRGRGFPSARCYAVFGPGTGVGKVVFVF